VYGTLVEESSSEGGLLSLSKLMVFCEFLLCRPSYPLMLLADETQVDQTGFSTDLFRVQTMASRVRPLELSAGLAGFL
jgi:hypothetical protein